MIFAPSSKKRKIDVDNEPDCHNKYDMLLQRLAQAQQALVPEGLQALVSQGDLQLIFDYFKVDPNLRKTRDRSKRHQYLEQIASLKPCESYRLDKKDTHLPRTITILCDRTGELELLVETKSKLANNRKQHISDTTGGYKIGKPAWRIDNYEEYFNLVAKIASDSDYERIQEEVNTSARLSDEYVNQTQLGPIIEKNKEKKVSIYSKKAISNLQEFIRNHRLSRALIDALTHQLLNALKYLHEQKIIHQDIKSANILVYGNARTGYYIKISDFGNSVDEESGQDSLSTWEYSSPEILNYYKRPDSSQYEYFNDDSAVRPFGDQNIRQTTLRSWGVSHKTNDIWAMGVLIFELRYGVKPEEKDRKIIDQDPLLSGMLSVNRHKRFTIDQALHTFDMVLSQGLRGVRARSRYQ